MAKVILLRAAKSTGQPRSWGSLGKPDYFNNYCTCLAALPGLPLRSSSSSRPVPSPSRLGAFKAPCLHRHSSLSSSSSSSPCPGAAPGRSGGAVVEGCCHRGGHAWLHPCGRTPTCRSSSLCGSWGGFLAVAGPKSHPWGSSTLLGSVDLHLNTPKLEEPLLNQRKSHCRNCHDPHPLAVFHLLCDTWDKT